MLVMNYRRFGRTGFHISEIGYGAWGIGGKQWLGGTDEESSAAVRRALELGVNFIDTALAYNEGHSERLLAPLVKEASQRVYIATKIPPMNRIWPAQSGTPLADVFPYHYAIECTETSLKNLQAETLDLQQFHVWNPEWLHQDEWRRAIEDLKKSGKVQYFGISINDHQPDSALEAIQTGLIDTVQVIYNIFDQSPEAHLLPLCEAHDIGVIARVPLDEGSLTGTITENSVFDGDEFRGMYFAGDRKRQVVEHVAKLQADLTDVEGSLPQIALRFCLTPKAVTTVIPGMRRIKNVEANCAAAALGPLPENVKQRLKAHAWEKNFYSAV